MKKIVVIILIIGIALISTALYLEKSSSDTISSATPSDEPSSIFSYLSSVSSTQSSNNDLSEAYMFENLGVYFWSIVIVQAVIFAAASSYLAGQKNKNKITWFFIGALLGFVGLIMIAASKSEHVSTDNFKNIPSNNIKSNINASKSYESPIRFIDLDSPVEIIVVSILIEDKSQHPYLNIKLLNLSNKIIKGVKFTVNCYDSFGELISNPSKKDFKLVMQDLDVVPKSMFGDLYNYSLIEFPNTRTVDIIIDVVSFEEGLAWKKGENSLKYIDSNQNLTQEELVVLKNIVGNDASNYPDSEDDSWLCVCGRYNKVDDLECIRCDRDKSEMFEKINITTVHIRHNNNLEIAANKKSEKDIIRKKRNKKIYIVLSVLTAISITTFGITYISGLKQEKQEELLFAVAINDPTKVEKLINNGADLNQDADKIVSSLRKESGVLFKLLLENGFDSSFTDKNGNTLLHKAAFTLDGSEIIEMLIRKGLFVNTLNFEGKSPIHVAVENNVENNIIALVENGADVNLLDSKKLSPLYYALTKDDTLTIVSYLIENGADYSQYNEKIEDLINNKNPGLIKLLVETGFDLNYRDKMDNTLLHKAAYLLDGLELIEILLDKGLYIDNVNIDGKTPLHIAAGNCNDERVVKILIENGANVEAKDKEGKTPLYYALINDNELDIVKYLIENGANINERFNNGQTVLHYASDKIDGYKLLNLLIEKDFDINSADNLGNTTLHLSLFNMKDYGFDKVLIENGINVNLKNEDGNTPLHISSRSDEKIEITKLLVTNGANINIENYKKLTPLDFAIQYNSYKNIEFLKNIGAN